jgi:hypothetical protein
MSSSSGGCNRKDSREGLVESYSHAKPWRARLDSLRGLHQCQNARLTICSLPSTVVGTHTHTPVWPLPRPECPQMMDEKETGQSWQTPAFRGRLEEGYTILLLPSSLSKTRAYF